jgi:hypothetical protein
MKRTASTRTPSTEPEAGPGVAEIMAVKWSDYLLGLFLSALRALYLAVGIVNAPEHFKFMSAMAATVKI